jgi:hypothetical protein
LEIWRKAIRGKQDCSISDENLKEDSVPQAVERELETVTLAKVKKKKPYRSKQKEYASKKIQLQYGFTRATGGRKPCQDFSL